MEISKTKVLNFDEWYKEAKKLNDDGFSAKDFFEAGQQSKQSEIDELKTANHNLSVMTAEAESYSEYWKHERDKLQKRVKELELINFDSELHFDAAKEHIDRLQKIIDDCIKAMDESICDIDCGTIYGILTGDNHE